MNLSPPASEFDGNPLVDDSPEVWDQLVQCLGPASILVCIRNRLSTQLRDQLSAEDIWQEALMSVWRDRSRCEWRGVRAFRHWVLTVIDNCIRDAADRSTARKRGGGVLPVSLDATNSPARAVAAPPLVSSTTPSKIASFAEQAEVMHAALDRVPEELREVVRLRLFEEVPVEDVAQRLDLGVSAVKHRFRKGALLYQQHLERLLKDRSQD